MVPHAIADQVHQQFMNNGCFNSLCKRKLPSSYSYKKTGVNISCYHFNLPVSHSTSLKCILKKSDILVCDNGQFPSQPKQKASARHSKAIFNHPFICPIPVAKDSLLDKFNNLLSPAFCSQVICVMTRCAETALVPPA